MRMTLPSAIIMAAAIWRTRNLMSGSPLPDKQDRNRGQAHESLSFFVRGGLGLARGVCRPLIPFEGLV